MNNYIELNDNKVYPKGNAKLLKSNTGSIMVSGLKDTMDGITINTNGKNRFELSIAPVSLTQPYTFGASMNILDKFNRVKTVAQWAYRPQIADSPAALVTNSRLEGKEILVQFYKNGKEVHRYTVMNECDSQQTNWLQLVVYAVVAVATAVVSAIDYESETTVTTDPNGKKTTVVRTKKSFGGGGKAKSSLSSNDDNYIDFDHIYFSSTRSFDTDVHDELNGPIKEVVFTGNFDSLELKSISNVF